MVLEISEAVVKTSGTYGGFHLYNPDTSRNLGTAFTIPNWDETGYPIGTLVYSYSSVNVPPGKYRINLYGDGVTHVTVPLEKGRSLTLRPKKRLPVEAAVVDLQAMPPLHHGDVRVPVDVPAGAVAFVATVAVAEHHQAGYMESCIANQGAPTCAQGGETPSTSAVYPSPGSIGGGWTMTKAAGKPSEGPKEVRLRVEGISNPILLGGFYLVAPM